MIGFSMPQAGQINLREGFEGGICLRARLSGQKTLSSCEIAD